MKRNITLIICLLCFGQMLMAQELLKEFKDNNNLYGLKDKNGIVVVEPKYTKISSIDSVLMKTGLNNKWGLIDGRTGKEIIPPEYYVIHKFADGAIMMAIKEDGMREKWGAINETGRETIPAIYEDVSFKVKGLVIVTLHIKGKARKMGIKDYEGREILPVIYNLIEPLKNDKGLLVSLDGKVGFFNNQGKEIIPANKYDLIDEMDKDGFMEVRKGKKFGLVNEQGKEIAKCIYDYLKGYYENGKLVGYFKDGYIRTQIGKKYGFIDTSGNEVPCKYEDIDMSSVRYGFVVAKHKGKYGIIDNKEREIVPFKFESIDLKSFSALENKDKSGKTILDYANLISPETGKALAYANERSHEDFLQEEKKREEQEIAIKKKREEQEIAREKDKINNGFNFLFKYQCSGTNRFSFLQGRKVSVLGSSMILTNTYNGEIQSSALHLRIVSSSESISNGVKYWTYNFYENENNYKSAIVEFNTGNYSNEMYSITLVSDTKDLIYCNDTNAAAGIK